MIEKTKFWEKTKASCKPAGKSVLAVAAGVALLAGSYGALAGFAGGFSLAPEGTQIESGALQLSVTEAGWTKNGVALAQDQLGAVALVPGDRVEYTAKVAAQHTGHFTSYLYLQEAEKIAGSLTDDSQATIMYSLDGEASGVKTITPELAGTKYGAVFSLTVAPGAKQRLSLDLSQIKVAASMVKPVGAGSGSGGDGSEVDPGAVTISLRPLTDALEADAQRRYETLALEAQPGGLFDSLSADIAAAVSNLSIPMVTTTVKDRRIETTLDPSFGKKVLARAISSGLAIDGAEVDWATGSATFADPSAMYSAGSQLGGDLEYRLGEAMREELRASTDNVLSMKFDVEARSTMPAKTVAASFEAIGSTADLAFGVLNFDFQGLQPLDEANPSLSGPVMDAAQSAGVRAHEISDTQLFNHPYHDSTGGFPIMVSDAWHESIRAAGW